MNGSRRSELRRARTRETVSENAALVQDALDQKLAEAAGRQAGRIKRPLKTFGCQLMVSLVYHLPDHKRAKGRTRSRLAILRDNVHFRDVKEWAASLLKVPQKERDGIVLQYFDQDEAAHDISSEGAFKRWIDSSWMRHPLKLHLTTMDSMMRASAAASEQMESLFMQYDADQDGKLELEEVRLILREMDLAAELDISSRELADFCQEQFEKADLNGSGCIDYDEFVEWYNGLRGYLQAFNTRDSRNKHRQLVAKASWVEAHATPCTLSEVFSRLEGKVRLDYKLNQSGCGEEQKGESFKYGYDYAVDLHFSNECLTPETRDHVLRANTVLDDKVDFFDDETEGGEMGTLCSPIVEVKIEHPGSASAGGFAPRGSCTIRLPHCFDPETVSKADVLLCYGDPIDTSWTEMDCDSFEILPATGDFPPSLLVTLDMPGFVCACSRNSRPRTPQRVQCFAYVPEEMNPLEIEVMHLYLMRCCPDAFEEAEFIETSTRGEVSLAGKSEPMLVCSGDSVIQVALTQGSNSSHKELVWDGASSQIAVHFNPGLVRSCEVMRPSITCTAYDRFDHTRRAAQGGQAEAKCSSSFRLFCEVHNYPPPSAPLTLRLKARTTTHISFHWDPPAQWGGCALKEYEVQLREVTIDGTKKDWIKQIIGASKTETGFAMNVHACDLRVRAYNVGEVEPSSWTKLAVPPECEERAASMIQASVRGRHGRSRAAHIKSEQGAAVVQQGELDEVKADIGFKLDTQMEGWSLFRRKIGEFFLELGVPKGVSGTCFELTPKQVERLAGTDNVGEDGLEGSDLNKPLATLACAGIWVMGTLAHHTADAEAWISLTNHVSGLVAMAIKQQRPADPTGYAAMRELLFLLHGMYETMRQASEDGIIVQHLKYKYDKKLKKQHKADFEETLADMHEEASRIVLQLTLRARELDDEGLAA